MRFYKILTDIIKAIFAFFTYMNLFSNTQNLGFTSTPRIFINIISSLKILYYIITIMNIPQISLCMSSYN